MVVFSDKSPKEPEMHMQLKQCCSGVILVVVDPITGNQVPGGSVLGITMDGVLHLHQSVNPDIGLQLDGVGQIKLS